MQLHPTNPGEAEFLNDEELATITGQSQGGRQARWLREHGWRYELGGGSRVLVGRMYCRLRLAGIDLSKIEAEFTPDYSDVT